MTNIEETKTDDLDKTITHDPDISNKSLWKAKSQVAWSGFKRGLLFVAMAILPITLATAGFVLGGAIGAALFGTTGMWIVGGLGAVGMAYYGILAVKDALVPQNEVHAQMVKNAREKHDDIKRALGAQTKVVQKVEKVQVTQGHTEIPITT